MKKLILMLLISTTSFSQSKTYASLQGDVRNGTFGSSPTNNKAKLDMLLRFGAIGTAGVGVGIKGGIVIEKFNAIDFNKYCAEVGYDLGNLKLKGDFEVLGIRILDLSKFDFQTSIEFGWIERYKMNSWCVGSNVDIIYFFNDHIGFIVTNNLLSRTDLNELYGGNNWMFSNYAGVTYKF